MFVPKEWGHLQRKPFTKYGYKYSCMAQWILVQMAAKKMQPVSHFFDMTPKELPEITEVTEDVLDEGLEAMLGDVDDIPELYASYNPLLGIGMSKIRAEFGTPYNGKNVCGLAIQRVLRKRKAKKDAVQDMPGGGGGYDPTLQVQGEHGECSPSMPAKVVGGVSENRM